MKLNYNPNKETDSFHCLEMDIGTFFLYTFSYSIYLVINYQHIIYKSRHLAYRIDKESVFFYSLYTYYIRLYSHTKFNVFS